MTYQFNPRDDIIKQPRGDWKLRKISIYLPWRESHTREIHVRVSDRAEDYPTCRRAYSHRSVPYVSSSLRALLSRQVVCLAVDGAGRDPYEMYTRSQHLEHTAPLVVV